MGSFTGSKFMRAALALTAVGALTTIVGTSGAGAATAKVTKLVNTPVLPGGIQKGVDIRWDYNHESPLLVRSEIDTTLLYVKGLHANAVSITFPVYVPGPTSNTVETESSTPPPADLESVISAAHAEGFFVLVRPLVEEVNPSAPWRGIITPKNRTVWFNNYLNVLKPYFQAANTGKANEFAMSVELDSLAADYRWNKVVEPYAKKYFSGAIMIDDNWVSPGMDPLPSATFGLDAYRPVNLPATATVAQILAGWQGWLTRLKLPVAPSHTYITEAGLAAQSAAYYHPSVWNFGTPLIPSVQTKWFQAACQFFKQNHFAGLYFWSTDLTQGPQLFTTGGYPQDFQGTTNAAIRACFA